jgi:hypothetical protein
MKNSVNLYSNPFNLEKLGQDPKAPLTRTQNKDVSWTEKVLEFESGSASDHVQTATLPAPVWRRIY